MNLLLKKIDYLLSKFSKNDEYSSGYKDALQDIKNFIYEKQLENH